MLRLTVTCPTFSAKKIYSLTSISIASPDLPPTLDVVFKNSMSSLLRKISCHRQKEEYCVESSSLDKP